MLPGVIYTTEYLDLFGAEFGLTRNDLLNYVFVRGRWLSPVC